MIKFKEGKLPEDPLERMKYLCRFRELLRLFHNKKGQEMELEKFKVWQKEWFDPKNNLISEEISNCFPFLRKKYYNDENITVNLDDIEDGE